MQYAIDPCYVSYNYVEEHGLTGACRGRLITFGGAFRFIAGRHRPLSAWKPKVVSNGAHFQVG